MLHLDVTRVCPADVELIPIQTVEDAYARMLAGEVRSRLVIDLASPQS